MKVRLGQVPLVYPVPIVLAGANVGGKPNYATLGDCGIMGIDPPLVYVSLHRDHYTTQGISANGTFSVNIPSTDLLAVTDYCGVVSGREVDKSELFDTFYGEVEVHTIAPGHTACDSYLVLPEEHIIFMGDLGFFQSQPFIAFCDPAAWQAWLQAMEDSDVEVFVPGHGPLGSRIDLGLQRQYLAAIMNLVARVIEQSGSVEDALGETLPEPFDDWVQAGAARWESNIYSMHERLSEQ